MRTSLGAALAAMVGNLTAGKPKFAGREAELESLIAEADSLRLRLAALVDADAEAFLPLSRAYALPKDAPGRDGELEKCLRAAAEVPMEVLRLAAEGIALHERLCGNCSALAVSDVGTGVVFCWAALYGAAMNVRVNTHLMKDREYAAKLDAEVSALMDKYWKIADEVYGKVWDALA